MWKSCECRASVFMPGVKLKLSPFHETEVGLPTLFCCVKINLDQKLALIFSSCFTLNLLSSLLRCPAWLLERHAAEPTVPHLSVRVADLFSYLCIGYMFVRIKSALELFFNIHFQSCAACCFIFMPSCGNVETTYILCIRWALFQVQVLGKVYLCNDARSITFPVYFFRCCLLILCFLPSQQYWERGKVKSHRLISSVCWVFFKMCTLYRL